MTCPSCGASMAVFYEHHNVPAHDVLLVPTLEKALKCRKGNIALGFCRECGLIYNTAFDPALPEYVEGYNPTQASSPTFGVFHRQMAENLIEKHDIYRKDIIDIGCGNGELIKLLCELGNNRGIGFCPSYPGEDTEKVKFIKEFYPGNYNGKADLICCKMTLEHIHNPTEFLKTLHNSAKESTVLFFQVPDAGRIMRELAFWDIYYEHCTYFSINSLSALFQRCGFEVINIWKGFDNQYIMIEAKPGIQSPSRGDEELARDVDYFAKNHKKKMDRWKSYLDAQKRKKVVLWGGGSKGVAFLTTLNIKDQVEYVVDIDAAKHGTYIAGTGQKIVAPSFLQEYKPDVIIVMSPVYKDEIRTVVNKLGLTPEFLYV